MACRLVFAVVLIFYGSTAMGAHVGLSTESIAPPVCIVSCSESERILKRLEEQGRMLQRINGRLNAQDPCRDRKAAVCDCSHIRANGYLTSGTYRIYVDHRLKRYYASAYCDMKTGGGGWTVFQRRKDGSVDFHREWNDYANGFGNPKEEFWIGNDILHFLTSKKRYQLRVDIWDFEGEHRFAQYSTVNVSSSVEYYRLSIGEYSGNAGDSLRSHNNLKFSSFDHNIRNVRTCALDCQGGWWYRNYEDDGCADSNLNGPYLPGKLASTCSTCSCRGIQWGKWRGKNYSLKTAEMKIRP